jgi:UDP-N-acetylmuramyl pentapeptide phosphotransferase/UDP-N-acetylglucosamine-1-phosphate transferase
MIEMSLWIAVPFTTLWIMAVINGFNFMDGVDGLAAIVTIIALAGLGFIINLVGGPISGMVWPAAIGAMVAFLWFNWRPPRSTWGYRRLYRWHVRRHHADLRRGQRP